MGRKKLGKREKDRVFLYSKLFFAFLIVFFVAFISLFLIEYVDFYFVKDSFSSPYEVSVVDGCSLIMGNLVHYIRDETDCKLNCASRCEIDSAKYYNSSFEFSNSSCSSCSCYCD